MQRRQDVLYLSVVFYTSTEMCCKFSWYWLCSSRSSRNFGLCKASVNTLELGLIRAVVVEVELGHDKVGFVGPTLITMEKQSQY